MRKSKVLISTFLLTLFVLGMTGCSSKKTKPFDRDEIIKQWEQNNIQKHDPAKENIQYAAVGDSMVGEYFTDCDKEDIRVLDDNEFGVFFEQDPIVRLDRAKVKYDEDVELDVCLVEFTNADEAQEYVDKVFEEIKKTDDETLKTFDKMVKGRDQKIAVVNDIEYKFVGLYTANEKVVIVQGVYMHHNCIRNAYVDLFGYTITTPAQVVDA